MFKNIQLDPKITYTNSLYTFLFGSLDQGQKCTERDSIIIESFKEIDSVGVKVFIKSIDSLHTNVHFRFTVIDGNEDDYKRVTQLFTNCELKLIELNKRSKFQKMIHDVKNWFRGGFNNPTLVQADKMPLVLPEKKMKPAVSFEKIKNASDNHTIEPLNPVRTKGISAWFRGSFNNPKN